MSVVPVLSKNGVAYWVGTWVGDQVTSPLLNKVTKHLDSYSASTRRKIEYLVPFIGIGIATSAAYSIYPRSKALTLTNLFLQGVVSGIHTWAVRFFLDESKGGVYTIEAQIEKYLGVSEWAKKRKKADDALKLISEWDFYNDLSQDDRDQLATLTLENPLKLNGAPLEDPNKTAKRNTTLSLFQTKTIEERQRTAGFLNAYYSKTREERAEYEAKLKKTRHDAHWAVLIFDGGAFLFSRKYQERLVGPSVPFAFTDRCCTLFPPFYLLRKVLPIPSLTCNRNAILISSVFYSVCKVARLILEYIPSKNFLNSIGQSFENRL